MARTFSNATAFDKDIGLWDVSKVTNMGSMFNGAGSFNWNLSGWDVSKVTSCNYFSYNAVSWNSAYKPGGACAGN
jgi:surface protein